MVRWTGCFSHSILASHGCSGLLLGVRFRRQRSSELHTPTFELSKSCQGGPWDITPWKQCSMYLISLFSDRYRRILCLSLPFEGLLALEELSACKRYDVEKTWAVDVAETTGKWWAALLRFRAHTISQPFRKLDIRESETIL